MLDYVSISLTLAAVASLSTAGCLAVYTWKSGCTWQDARGIVFAYSKKIFFAVRSFGGSAVAESSSEPTNWCLVGNIVEEHEFGESKERRGGTKHFTAGTKVYCLPPQWGDGYEKNIVVGIARGSRSWITVVLPSRHITNWRAKVVYKPALLRRLRDGFEGHKQQWRSQKQVESWAQFLRGSSGSANQPPGRKKSSFLTYLLLALAIAICLALICAAIVTLWVAWPFRP